MIVIDGQRCRAREPKYLSALDLNSRHEGHEHTLIVIRMVNDLHVWILRRGRRRRKKRGAHAEDGKPESGAKCVYDLDHHCLRWVDMTLTRAPAGEVKTDG